MNRQEVIDNHINIFGGEWIFDGQDSAWLTDDWKITKDEFNARASELGWINSYQWGKEYPTNGKKPDLPDDLYIEYKNKHDIWHKLGPDRVDAWVWHDGAKAFRIVDTRYKPKQPESHSNPSDGFLEAAYSLKKLGAALYKSDNSWHDRGELPPVGVECEYLCNPDKGRFRVCKILATHGEQVAFCIDSQPDRIFVSTSEKAKFRPIKSDRDKFVEAALAVMQTKRISNTQRKTINRLFDAGFRAPE